MTIDCDRCTASGLACSHCAVTFVTGDGTGHVTADITSDVIVEGAGPGHRVELDAAELRALAALANAGMIPPLRYAPALAKAS
jgi:hypothetical protein